MACITLLSDFGLQDASVAIAKAVLMQHTVGLPIIDISHEVMPFQSKQAAYLLSSAYINFPESTCHLLIFDLFSSPSPRLILSMYKGHYFLSADSDLVSTALGQLPDAVWLCLELKKEDTFTHWLAAAATIIQQLQTRPPAQLGFPLHSKPLAISDEQDVAEANTIACEVIHIDRYENVILSISRAQFEANSAGRSFKLKFMEIEEITELSINYNDVKEGYKLCRFNSSNKLEICVNRGRAASLFGLRVGSTHNKVKLVFE